jgi:hypothetical protein
MKQRIRDFLGLAHEDKLLIWDLQGFACILDYNQLLIEEGFSVISYEDVEAFRYIYEAEIKKGIGKYAVIINSEIYVPYDVKTAMRNVCLSLETIYPRLKTTVLGNNLEHLPLIDMAYDALYANMSSTQQTERFIRDRVLSKEQVAKYLEREEQALLEQAQVAGSHSDWVDIAKRSATLAYYAASHNLDRTTATLNRLFHTFIDSNYTSFSGVVNASTPAILTKTLSTIAHGKTALIVMDGMSMTDFEVIKRTAWPFESEESGTFALIPTITSISRQSLLTGKYPQELDNQFSLAKEESGFYQAASMLGYSAAQSFYGRGFDVQLSNQVSFAAIIINEMDDIVHGQLQGDAGMYQDMRLLAENGKLQQLIMRLYHHGFNVYLTSDHGHITCTGNGLTQRFGLEAETKAQRVIILKGFAEASDALKEIGHPFPATYLNKDYQYYLANDNTAFAAKDRQLVTHGGASIEEVVVPFIRIKGVK